MDKEEKEICLVVAELIKSMFGIPEEFLRPEDWERSLTSKEIGLTGIELVYLLFEIEKIYGVRLSSDVFDNHGFDSILKIYGTLHQLIKGSYHYKMDNYYN